MQYIRNYIRKAIWVALREIARINPMWANDLHYFRMFKKKLNRKNPRTFSEHVIVAMESPEMEERSSYADKYEVRNYVREKIGSEYLLPLLQVYDTPEDIRWEEIPEGAYLKLNHGSGYNLVYEKEKRADIERQIREWYQIDYSRRRMERQYHRIVRKILVEENVKPQGELLWEYSFFTFHGQVEFAQIRDNAGHRFEVGRAYEKLPYRLYSYVTEIEPEVPEYRDMVEKAEILAQPFAFVRVDFFRVGHQVYFGELTFAPGAGVRCFSPMEYNIIMGDKIKGV